MRFVTVPVPFGAFPSLARDHVLARLADTGVPSFPLLRPDSPLPEGTAELYVVAGQQPGLLTGPLYTVLKAATCLSVARALSLRAARPVRPLFWIASEDHDVLEVNRVTLNGRTLVVPYRGVIRRGTVPPVGAISLREDRDTVLSFVREALPETAYTESVLELVRGARFDSYATQCADLLTGVFAPWALGTTFPEELRVRTGPVLAELVARWSDTREAFARGSDRVRSAGLAPPLESPGFFELVGGNRVPVTVEAGSSAGGDAVVHLSGGAVSLADAADQIRAEPHWFSPGAALRPVVQDAALPVAATVAGPTEILYLWQIRDIYDVAGVRPSWLVPRLSCTFVEKRVGRKLKKLGVPLEEVFSIPGRLAAWSEAAAVSTGPEIEAIEAAVRALGAALDAARNPANERWLDRSRRTLDKHVEKTIVRLRDEGVHAADATGDMLRAVADEVVPGGKPQERVSNLLEFMNRYGTAWVRALAEDMDPWDLTHRVVTIETT